MYAFVQKKNKMVIKIQQNFFRIKTEINVFPVISEALNFKAFWEACPRTPLVTFVR